jgi:putative oxidoreductase
VQRLFSTFPEGWPGAGLLFLRAVATIPAVQHGIAGLLSTPLPPHLVPQLIAAAAATLLLAGLWTPVAGVLLALAEIVLAFSHSPDPHSHDPWIHILLGALGAALAMLGPGAWSVDAHRFGRKRIRLPQR